MGSISSKPVAVSYLLTRPSSSATTDSLHQEEILLLGDLNQDLALCGIDGEGFLAENVFAGLETQPHVLVMVAVRRGDVDDVHVRVGNEFFVASIRLCRLGRIDLPQKLFRSVGRGRGGGSNDNVLNVLDAAGFWVDGQVSSKAAGNATLPK